MTSGAVSNHPATDEEIPAIARMIKAFFPTNRPARVGLKYSEELCRYYMSSPHSFVLTACIGEKVIGYTIVKLGNVRKRLPRNLLLMTLIPTLPHPWIILREGMFWLWFVRGFQALFRRRKSIQPLAPATVPPYEVISSNGVDMDLRRAAVTGRPLSAMEVEAVTRGFTTLYGPASETNVATWSMYEKQGWIHREHLKTDAAQHYYCEAPA